MDVAIRKNIGVYLSYLMKVLIVLAGLYSFHVGDYLWTFWSFFCFFLTLTPVLVKRRLKMNLPWELNSLLVLVLFLYVAGNIGGFYSIYAPVYDKIHHFLGGALVAMLGLVSVAILEYYTEINMGRYMLVFFIVILSVAIGAFAEMVEFLYDTVLGTSLQPSLHDTMIDLIVDTFGGIIIAVPGYSYLKYTPTERFVESMRTS